MTTKILLVDVDSKIPNLALMKISTYYKQQGCLVELRKIGYSYYPHNKNCMVFVDEYDKVFVSTIFKINVGRISFVGNSEIVKGGVGYDLTNKLSEQIESLEPDYSLYPDNNFSYGFITRGCIRNCDFCVVRKKEGLIHQVNTISNIVKHKKVKFLDNNILAFNRHLDILKELKEKKIRCQFNQGLDIRLINDNNAKLLSELKYLGEYIFAFDNIMDKNKIEKGLYILKKYITKDWKIKFYIYCNPCMDIQEDVLNRINWCRKNKVLPYLMRDISCWKSDKKDFYTDLCAYCNQPNMFKKLSFEQFMQKRTKNVQRQKESKRIYYSHKPKVEGSPRLEETSEGRTSIPPTNELAGILEVIL